MTRKSAGTRRRPGRPRTVAAGIVVHSPVGRAIAELEIERQHLSVRLTKVDEAIASLRALFHLPAPPMLAARRMPRAAHDVTTARGHAHTNGAGDDVTARILQALGDQPLSPGALAMVVGLDRVTVRKRVKELERAGQLVSSGVTANRQIALAAAAAKEAPRRSGAARAAAAD